MCLKTPLIALKVSQGLRKEEKGATHKHVSENKKWLLPLKPKAVIADGLSIQTQTSE